MLSLIRTVETVMGANGLLDSSIEPPENHRKTLDSLMKHASVTVRRSPEAAGVCLGWSWLRGHSFSNPHASCRQRRQAALIGERRCAEVDVANVALTVLDLTAHAGDTDWRARSIHFFFFPLGVRVRVRAVLFSEASVWKIKL